MRRTGLEPEWKESTQWTDSTEAYVRSEAPTRRRRECTSTGVTPLAPRGLSVTGADLEELLAAEARSLLRAAASGIPLEPERLRAFARACLEVSEVGRLALAVLDGGVFAPRRGLELAGVVTKAAVVTTTTEKLNL